MRDNETDDSAKLAGCGMTVIVVLFMFGSWIGGQ